MKTLLANDFGRLRGLEVVRGWLVFLLVLALFAVVPLGLWQLGVGPAGLLGGLVVLAAVVVAYSISSSR